jgi:probable F420-dependent oxidoreductase
MNFGYDIPTRGPLAAPENVTAIAQKGEALGFGTAYVNDHIVIPTDIASRYPYSEDGGWAGGQFGEAMDILAYLAYLASATSKVRLLTSVMVVPYRNPVVTAKTIATIDVLSGGRVTIGCGAGWMEEEFIAVGAPPFKERGKSTDEYLEIFRELWTSEAPSYDGAYASFSNILALPQPRQSRLPLWIGGESRPALRRTARLGDGWYPIGYNPKFPLDTLGRFKGRLGVLKEEAEKVNREPDSIDLAYSATWFKGPCEAVDVDGERRLFTGSADDVKSDMAAMAELGVNHLMFRFVGASMPETEDRMTAFAETFIVD